MTETHRLGVLLSEHLYTKNDTIGLELFNNYLLAVVAEIQTQIDELKKEREKLDSKIQSYQ